MTKYIDDGDWTPLEIKNTQKWYIVTFGIWENSKSELEERVFSLRRTRSS